MDLKTKEEGEEVPIGDEERGSLSDKNMAAKCPGSISSEDMIFRADKIDLKNLDVQLEKHLSHVWSSNYTEKQNQRPKEEWEIDPTILEIRYHVAKGTYGTVYRVTYDNQYVALELLETIGTSKGGGKIPEDQAGGGCFCFAPTRGP